MTNSRASSGAAEIIENYTQSGTGTTKTFTITSDDFSNTSKYTVIIDGNVTAALALQMKINGATTGYYQQGRSITAGAETLINDSNTATAVLLTAAILSSSVRPFHVEVEIYATSTATTDHIMWRNRAVAAQAESETVTGGFLIADHNAITSIEIKVSTSSWIANTRMTLYRLKRT